MAGPHESEGPPFLFESTVIVDNDSGRSLLGRLGEMMVDTSVADGWLAIKRNDGEIVGFVEPLEADYSRVQARNRLGHKLGSPSEYVEAEDQILALGLSFLAERWFVADPPAFLVNGAVIKELSPSGIVLIDADFAKAGISQESLTIDWPDIEGKLSAVQHS